MFTIFENFKAIGKKLQKYRVNKLWHRRGHRRMATHIWVTGNNSKSRCLPSPQGRGRHKYIHVCPNSRDTTHLPNNLFLMVILILDWLAMRRSGVVMRLGSPRSRAFASILSVCHSASLKMRISPLMSSLSRVRRRSPDSHVGVLLCTIILDSWNLILKWILNTKDENL